MKSIRRWQKTTTLALSLAWTGACDDDGGRADDNASSGSATTTTSTSGATEIPEDPPPPKSDLGLDPPLACSPYCETLEACVGQSRTDCLIGCTQAVAEREENGATCAADYEALLGCVGALSCDDVAAWQTASGPDYPCATEEATAELSCTPGGDMPSASCAALCETAQGCTGEPVDACIAACTQAEQTAAEIGPECADAQVAVFECAAALTCADYAAWTEAVGEYPCRSEDEAFQTACIGA